MPDDPARSARFVPPTITPPEAPLPRFRAMWTLMDNPIEAWPRAVYEEPYLLRENNAQKFLYVTDPAMLKTILLDRTDAFPKDWMFERVTKPALGEGLLTAQGAHWRWQRRAAAPGFRPQNIEPMAGAMVAAAEAALGRWRERGDGARLDVAREMTAITFDVILETMLSGGEGIDAATAAKRITDYLETLGRVTPADFLQLPLWTRIALAPRGYRALVELKAMVDRMIQRRRREAARGDLVDLLMAAEDPETGRRMSNELLRDNLLTFIGAGHETTALALTWSLYLLGSVPEAAARVRAEVAEVVGEGRVIAGHVERLTFTRQVIQEAMRLYPSLPIMSRMCAEDVQVGDLAVTKGTFVFIAVYALHRHRALWRDPDAFDPDRFSAAESERRHRFAYLPFGGGPRVCIGQGFAMMEAVAVLATLVRGATLVPDPGHRIRPVVRVSMRPEGGMPMTLRL
ncbi:cytochrome P450 [Phenylobacterium sp. J367]|uniref:cytochrome P450 n=1 Tax=Phenylobacterium sp. J367 TaxID=2898435 RepID=UPI002151B880|nr:cytochrome P450 [Phenylobacterium sp. J367]MCR5878982.1 cytochrome P450 [Phenylobacterium sp. J367]